MIYVHNAREVALQSAQQSASTSMAPVDSGTLGSNQAYTDIEVDFAAEDGTFWCFLKPQLRPSFTEAVLNDLHAMQRRVSALAARRGPSGDPLVRYFVLASRTPGVFNLGGDLTLFSRAIRAQDRDGLRRYAHSCVESGYLNSVGYNAGVVTIGLAQGDAMGGGWECLMSCDVLVAEKRARFALPEVVFNMFPGMGAASYLTRRLGVVKAEQIMMSGKVYTADEMHALGAVDLVVEDGEGLQAVQRHIRRSAARHNAHSAIYAARRRVSPVTLDELREVADIWVDAAMRLPDSDLRRMAHIASAQDRNRRRVAASAIAAE
jgi:DSF synthase